MPQHDGTVGNDTGAAVRADINALAAALFGLSSGATAPATTFAFMWWADTANGIVQQRNAANSAWIPRFTIANAEGLFPDGLVGTPSIGFASDPDNGFYRVGSNSWAAAVAGAQGMLFNAGGEVNFPLQPEFVAYLSANDPNVTGAGTARTVPFNAERYDANADFNTGTGTFTAPVSGYYDFSTTVEVEDLSTAATVLTITIATSNFNYLFQTGLNPKSGALIAAGTAAVQGAFLDAGDIAQVQVAVAGMAGDTADISGSSTMITHFSGGLRS